MNNIQTIIKMAVETLESLIKLILFIQDLRTCKNMAGIRNV